MKVTKVTLNINDDGAYVELTYEDGSTKTWKEELTTYENATIASAGMLMQRGSMIHALMFIPYSCKRKFDKLNRLLSEAEKVASEIINLGGNK